MTALRDFMAENRDELLSLCVQRMKSASPERSEAELSADYGVVLDEIVDALQQNAGFSAAAPPPRMSEAASRHGGKRQLSGYRIEKIALDFGALSDSVGGLAASKGLSFAARDYQVFNQCLDTSIASAIEQFWTQAKQQLEEAATARLGFLAHELRNALSSARMSLSILKRGERAIGSRTGAVLERSLQRLQNLIDQTLLEVQLHSGASPRRQSIQVATLLGELREAAVPERGIRLVVEADETLAVDADERLLVSALSNLVQNAMKFTRSGGRVVLRGRLEEEFAVMEVEDECGGLPVAPEELIEPFVQRGTDRRGLGLGLPITREAVEAQGGELKVRNLPGRGCVFGVRLRAAYVQPAGGSAQ